MNTSNTPAKKSAQAKIATTLKKALKKVEPAAAKAPCWLIHQFPGVAAFFVHTGPTDAQTTPFRFANKRVAEAWMEWLNDHSVMPAASLQVSIKSIFIHAALQAVDPMPNDGAPEMVSLTKSVLAQGVIEDGKVVPSQTAGEWLLIDGRRRFAASRMAGCVTFPVKVVCEADSPEIITALLAMRKHFTKGALAYFCLRWLHPIVKNAIARKHSNLRHGNTDPEEIPVEITTRLEDECDQLGFSRALYFQAARVREIFTEDADYKAQIEPKIYSGEVGLGAVIAGWAGRTATKGAGKQPKVNYLSLDAKGRATGLMPKALTTLENGFKAWPKLDLAARAALKTQWDALVAAVPADLT